MIKSAVLAAKCFLPSVHRVIFCFKDHSRFDSPYRVTVFMHLFFPDCPARHKITCLYMFFTGRKKDERRRCSSDNHHGSHQPAGSSTASREQAVLHSAAFYQCVSVSKSPVFLNVLHLVWSEPRSSGAL